ncbi:hypothetical protein GCM10025762_44900 [Haloechinothrix salitolerans]
MRLPGRTGFDAWTTPSPMWAPARGLWNAIAGECARHWLGAYPSEKTLRLAPSSWQHPRGQPELTARSNDAFHAATE